jgi:glycine oxidase
LQLNLQLTGGKEQSEPEFILVKDSHISDVLIVGAGVVGLSLARALHKKGAGKITILERGIVGREASFAAAGMLAPHAETEKPDDFFHFCAESNKLYPNFAAQIFDETGVDIELDRSGTLYLAFTERDAEEIGKRYEWQKKAGLEVERLTAQEARKAEPFASPDVREALFFPNDWQVENRKLLAALQKYVEANQIEVVLDTEVSNLLIEKGKVIGAETATNKFLAESVVLATGAWTSFIKAGGKNAFALPAIKPIRGQMICFQTAKRLFERVIYSPRGYIVPRIDGRILVGATVEDAGFDKSVTPSGLDFLFDMAAEIAPALINLQPSETWAGLRPFAVDGLPILGELSDVKNLFVASGHYRNGILLAPLTAEILADKIVGKSQSKYLEVFSPRRFDRNNAQRTAQISDTI